LHHLYIDKFAGRASPVHLLDPRLKLLLLILYIITVATTPIRSTHLFAYYFALVFAIIPLARLPFSYIILRSLIVLPFALMLGIFAPFTVGREVVATLSLGSWVLEVRLEGLWILLGVSLKSLLSVAATMVVVSTTRFHHLLSALQFFLVPKFVLSVLMFMYRYLFVLIDEIVRILRARNARCYALRRKGRLKVAGAIIGSLFLRTYERSERIYFAMLSRGYAGEIKTHYPYRITPSALTVFLTLAATLLSIRILG